MSGKILKRALALCLCMLLLAGSCLAEDSLEDFVPDALTEEELAQWQEWAEEGMGDSDAPAANAAELQYRGGPVQPGTQRGFARLCGEHSVAGRGQPQR